MKSNVPIFSQEIRNQATTFNSSDTTVAKAIITAGLNGAVVNEISLANSASNAYIVNLFFNNGTNYHLGSCFIPARAGYDGNQRVSLFHSTTFTGMTVNNNGNPELLLASQKSLYLGIDATIATSKVITVFVVSQDY